MTNPTAGQPAAPGGAPEPVLLHPRAVQRDRDLGPRGRRGRPEPLRRGRQLPVRGLRQEAGRVRHLPHPGLHLGRGGVLHHRQVSSQAIHLDYRPFVSSKVKKGSF